MEQNNFVEVVQTMFRLMMEPPSTGTVTHVVVTTVMMMVIIMVPILALPPFLEYGGVVSIIPPPTLEPSLARTL